MVGLVRDGTARRWDWYRIGLRHGGTRTRRDCDTMNLTDLLDGTDTGWDCDMVGLVQNGIATGWDWYRMGFRQGGTGTG